MIRNLFIIAAKLIVSTAAILGNTLDPDEGVVLNCVVVGSGSGTGVVRLVGAEKSLIYRHLYQ